MLIPLDAIEVKSRRPLVKGAVAALITSIEVLGLKVPIAVRPGKTPGRYILVAGRHRLEAYRRMERAEIEAEVFPDTLDAHLWEISENLHRAELTGLQRSLMIGKWIKVRGQKIKRDQRDSLVPGGPNPLGGRPATTGVNAAAEELNIPQTSAKRAVAISTGLKPSAQKVAAQLGLENQTHLLERVARLDTAKDQIAELRRFAAQKEDKAKVKAQTASALAGTNEPVTLKDVVWRWYHSLDAERQARARIEILGFDAEAFVEELEVIERQLRSDRAALH